VLPGKLLAGEHPGGPNKEATRERLQRLLAAGVECFIDLTYPTETTPYDTELPFSVEYLRKPIKDHSIPAEKAHMAEILDCIQDALRTGRVVYVHCRAGIGRTGTVMGCVLVERGLSGEEALDELNHVWQQCERSRHWMSVPETEEQSNYVLQWTPRRRTSDAAAVAPAAAVDSFETPGAQDADPLLEPETLSAARGLRERFHGALLGLAIGDALAAATQYRRPGTFAPVGDLLGGGPFDLPRGAWSDDTSMALCLAESLLERGDFDARDQMERYRLWQQQGHLSATGQCVGITASTARALAMSQWRRQMFFGSHDPDQLDPEALSRVAPVVMFYFAVSGLAVDQAAEAARTTCQAPGVLESCRTLARAVYAALSGHPKQAVMAFASQVPAISGSARGGKAGPATAPEVLAVAFEAFGGTDTFRDAVLRAANAGGSSDVAAAVCGQLAGAYYAVGAIPALWRNSLIQKALLEVCADRLLAHAMVGLIGG
jgi:ADP-ribosyl-[dinitrogen reductase] hydrolase